MAPSMQINSKSNSRLIPPVCMFFAVLSALVLHIIRRINVVTLYIVKRGTENL